MLGLFKKKSEKEILQKSYETLLKEAHTFSAVDRRRSDQKVAEAENVLQSLKSLDSEI